MGNTQVDYTSWNHQNYAWPPGKSNAITDDQLYLRPEKIVGFQCRRDRIECRLFEMMPSGVHDIAKCTTIPPDNITFTFPSGATASCLNSGAEMKTMGVPDMVLFSERSPVADHVTWMLRLVVFLEMTRCMNVRIPEMGGEYGLAQLMEGKTSQSDSGLTWIRPHAFYVDTLQNDFGFQSVHVCNPSGFGYQFTETRNISLIAVITLPKEFDHYPASLLVLSHMGNKKTTEDFPTFSVVVVLDGRSDFSKDDIMWRFTSMAKVARLTVVDMLNEIVKTGDPFERPEN